MKDYERRILAWSEDEEGAYLIAPGLELRATEQGKLEGYAVVYGAQSRDMGGFVEQIRPGAVELAADVLATFDHDVGSLLGRSGSGTLALTLDDRGLKYRIDLPNTSAGRDVAELVRRGDVRGSSFTFKTLEQRWQKQGTRALRILEKIRVTEVGPVTLPAYPDTDVAVRSLPRGGPAEQTEPDTPQGSRIETARRRLSILELYVGRGEG